MQLGSALLLADVRVPALGYVLLTDSRVPALGCLLCRCCAVWAGGGAAWARTFANAGAHRSAACLPIPRPADCDAAACRQSAVRGTSGQPPSPGPLAPSRLPRWVVGQGGGMIVCVCNCVSGGSELEDGLEPTHASPTHSIPRRARWRTLPAQPLTPLALLPALPLGPPRALLRR